MRLFSEKVQPTFTNSDYNILTVENFTEIFFDVYEFEISGKKFIAEKVAEYKGFPVVDIPLVLEGNKFNAPFILERGEFCVYYNPNNSTFVSVAEEDKGEPILELEEARDEVEEIIFERKEDILAEIQEARDSAAKFAESIRQQKLYQADTELVLKQERFSDELNITKAGLVEEFLGIIEGAKSEIYNFTETEQTKLAEYVVKHINKLSDTLVTEIEQKSLTAEKTFNTKLDELAANILTTAVVKEAAASRKHYDSVIKEKYQTISANVDKLVSAKIEALKANSQVELKAIEKTSFDAILNVNTNINKALSRVGTVKAQLNEALTTKAKELQDSITLAQDRISEYYDTKLQSIDSKIDNVTDEVRQQAIKLVEESKQSLLEAIDNIKVDVPNIIIEQKNGTSQEIDLKKVKKELEKTVTTKFTNEMMSLKRMIEMMSGGGSVAKQFAAGGTMNGDLTVTGAISASEYLGLVVPTPDLSQYLPISGGTITGGLVVQNGLSANYIYTTQLDALSANITVIDIKQYELSGFNVEGNVTINGNISSGDISPNTIILNNAPTIGAYNDGKIYYNSTERTVDVEVGNNITLGLARDITILVYNNTTQTLSAGAAVKISTSVGNRVDAALAFASGIPNLAFTSLSGVVTVTYNNHGYPDNTVVRVGNTTNPTTLRNGFYPITNVTTNTFDIVYGSGTASGTCTVSFPNQVGGIVIKPILSGAYGLIQSAGLVKNINTSALNIGDIIYLSDTTPGGYVNGTTSLDYSSRSNKIGYVVTKDASIGQIYVNIENENVNQSLTVIQRNILEGNTIATGVYEFDGMTLNGADPTHKVDIPPIKGWIVNNTGTYFSTSPAVTNVIFAGETNIAPAYLNTADSSYFLLNSLGVVYQQNTYPTPQERRENIYLGKAAHPNRSTILALNNTVDYDTSPMSALRDMFVPIPLINDGIVCSPDGANLSFNTSAGAVYGMGINWATNQKSPNKVEIAAKTPASFYYRTRLGGNAGITSLVDPTRYDLNGVVTTIPGGGNTSTNQRVYLYATGVLNIQYGQQTYSSLANAVAGQHEEYFVKSPNAVGSAVLIGIIAVRKNATNLSLATDAKFTPVSIFGEATGGTSGISTTTLQQAYDNSTTPEIITNAALGALTLKRGSAADTDNVFEIVNGAGDVTTSITGNGTVAADGLSITGDSSYGAAATFTYNSAAVTTHRNALGLGTTNSPTFSSLSLNTLSVSSNIANDETLANFIVNGASGLRIKRRSDGGGSEVIFNNSVSVVNQQFQHTGSNNAINLNSNGISISTGSNNTPIVLSPNGTGDVEIRNGLNSQEFRLYNTYTSATSAERATFKFVNNDFVIGAETLPLSGPQRSMLFQTNSATRMTILSSGQVSLTENLNLADQKGVTFAAGGLIYSTTNSFAMRAGSSNIFYLQGASAADVSFRMTYGGTTTAYPAIKRSGTSLEVKLADDSAYTRLNVGSLSANETTTTVGLAVAGDSAYGSATTFTYDPTAAATHRTALGVSKSFEVFHFFLNSTTSNAVSAGAGLWTWTIPTGAKTLSIEGVNGGGGGGSGRVGAAGTARYGGGGGAGSGRCYREVLVSSLASTTLTVKVGAGGLGGTAIPAGTINTDGNAGTTGTPNTVSQITLPDTTLVFGVHVNQGGATVNTNGGSGGTASAGNGGSGQGSWFSGGAGANSSITTAGNGPIANLAACAGGAGGGGIDTANTVRAGGPSYGNGGAGGAASIIADAVAGNTPSLTAFPAGGIGSFYGAGGGGGGAALNGFASGAGGNGAPGCIRIIVKY